MENVPGRSRIIFGHIANKPADLLGCVGFGLYYAGKNRIGGSVSAINLWMKYVKGTNEFDLLIINDPAMSFERDIGVAKRVTY